MELADDLRADAGNGKLVRLLNECSICTLYVSFYLTMIPNLIEYTIFFVGFPFVSSHSA